ncbi:MAG: hypothetical protein K0R08_1806 [Solimicrobium sp.]|jgi:hypothetical protein|nr:hypothetical protein [Solimicrobium sp.]
MKLLVNALFCLAFLFFNINAQAVELAGVKIDETIQVTSGTSASMLTLNGAGIRKKLFFKVYAAALYLPKTATKSESVIDMPGAKQMSLTMLRNVASNDLWQAIDEGIKQNNTPEELQKISDEFSQLKQLFSTIETLKEKDRISLTWVPDVGTIILLNDKKIGGTFLGSPFFNALLRIWIGEKPVDQSLKDQLLKGV